MVGESLVHVIGDQFAGLTAESVAQYPYRRVLGRKGKGKAVPVRFRGGTPSLHSVADLYVCQLSHVVF